MPSALHLHILASGSKGNAALVEGPKAQSSSIAVLSRRELLNRMSQFASLISTISKQFFLPTNTPITPPVFRYL